MKLAAELFLTFLRIGLFTFGGGYAMLPLIERACADKKGWITRDEMADITVIAESTPGPIAINCAAYVGYRQKKLAGAVCATVGVVLPSFVIIFLIAVFADRFSQYAVVRNAFAGVRLAVGVLIVDAGRRMAKRLPKKPQPLIFMGVACAVSLAAWLFSVHVSTAVMLLFFALVSLIVYFARRGHGEGGDRT